MALSSIARPVRLLIPLMAAALVAGSCGGGEPTTGYGYPYPQSCPAGEAVPVSRTVDTRTLVNQSVEDADTLARQYGCRIRVIGDGQHARRGRPARRIIELEARDGYVTRILAVGEP